MCIIDAEVGERFFLFRYLKSSTRSCYILVDESNSTPLLYDAVPMYNASFNPVTEFSTWSANKSRNGRGEENVHVCFFLVMAEIERAGKVEDKIGRFKIRGNWTVQNLSTL